MEFLNQNILYIMLIPLSFLIFLIVTNKDNLEKVFDKEILSRLTTNNKSLSKSARNSLFFLSLVFMIVALARPVILKEEIKLQQEGASIVLALDISKSMIADDVYPNRVLVAKKKIDDFLSMNKSDKIALIAFANDSFMVSPLTSDIDSMKYLLKNLDTDAISSGGTNILSALETTNKLLKDYKNKNLVIFSDGGDNSEFEKEIEYINEHNIRVYISNIGSNSPSPIKIKDGYLKDKDGNIVVVKRNDNIKELAKSSGGVFTTYSLDNSDIEAIYKDIVDNVKKNRYEQESIKDYYELFYIPLSVGLFILFLALSSIPVKRLVASSFVLFLYPQDSNALFFDFLDIQKAQEHYQKGEYKESTKIYNELTKHNKTNEAHYNLANSYYKDGKYKESIKEYSKIVTDDKEFEAKKLYNIGNSYVKQNNLQKAKEFYEKSLELKEDKDTRYNLEQVNKELEKQKKDNKNKKDSDNKDNKSQDKKDKNQDNKNEKNNKQNNKTNEDKKGDKKGKKEQNSNQKENEKREKIITKKEEKKWLNEIDKNQKTFIYRVPTTPQKPNDKYW